MRIALAESVHTEGSSDVDVTEAQDDERRELSRLLASIQPDADEPIALLPYRRVLTQGEREHWFEQLRRAWGVELRTGIRSSAQSFHRPSL
jgi:hypothetical protein